MTAHSVHSASGTRPYDDEPPPPLRRRATWLDWLDATDPGQLRLRMATEIVFAIGVVLAAEWLFVRVTGALQVPIPPRTPAAAAAELWMLNHALTVIAMMLGAILALIGGFGIGMFGTARAQLLLLLYLPLPMLALLAVGLSVHVRVVSLALLAVVLAIGTYCRRFGPPGFMGGMLAFMGAFLGFFIQDYVPLSEFGWLVAEVLIGTAGVIVVHFAFFRPKPEAAVRRMQRSYAARARGLASEVAELYEAISRAGESAEDRRAERRLQRQLLRLNEAALLIDAQLSPAAVPPAGAPPRCTSGCSTPRWRWATSPGSRSRSAGGRFPSGSARRSRPPWRASGRATCPRSLTVPPPSGSCSPTAISGGRR